MARHALKTKPASGPTSRKALAKTPVGSTKEPTQARATRKRGSEASTSAPTELRGPSRRGRTLSSTSSTDVTTEYACASPTYLKGRTPTTWRTCAPKAGAKASPPSAKPDPETRLAQLLDIVWRGKLTVKSDYARSNAEIVAMAASLQMLTTKTGVSTFASEWQITNIGLSWLTEQQSCEPPARREREHQ